MLVSDPNRGRYGKHGRSSLFVCFGLALAVVALAAVPLALAADLSAAAKVASATGRVSVLRNGESWALFEGNTVRVGEMIITGPDGMARLEISDGSSFDVYPNSQVVFRKNPSNTRELVDVVLGRIKLYIQKLGGSSNPYKIHSPTAVISVRGTVFEVDVDRDEVTWISVEEGTVLVQHRRFPDKVVELSAGEDLRVFPNAPIASLGINKGRLAARIAEAARDVLYVIRNIPGRVPKGPAAGPGPTSAPPGLPTDTQAPPPPPPPPPPPGPGNP